MPNPDQPLDGRGQFAGVPNDGRPVDLADQVRPPLGERKSPGEPGPVGDHVVNVEIRNLRSLHDAVAISLP